MFHPIAITLPAQAAPMPAFIGIHHVDDVARGKQLVDVLQFIVEEEKPNEWTPAYRQLFAKIQSDPELSALLPLVLDLDQIAE